MAPEEALRGYASWSAYAAFVEDLTKTLEVGKWADVTVMDLDPLVVGSSDPGRLLEGRVLLTLVAGKIGHDAS